MPPELDHCSSHETRKRGVPPQLAQRGCSTTGNLRSQGPWGRLAGVAQALDRPNMVDPASAARLLDRLEVLMDAIVEEEKYGDLDVAGLPINPKSGEVFSDWKPTQFLPETTGSCSALLDFLLEEAPALRELQMRLLGRYQWVLRYALNKLRPRGTPGSYTLRSALLIAYEDQPLVRATLLLMGKGAATRSASDCWGDLRLILKEMREGIRADVLASRRKPGPAAGSAAADPKSLQNRVLRSMEDGKPRTAKEVYLHGGFLDASSVRGVLPRLKKAHLVEVVHGTSPMQWRITREGTERLRALLSN